VPFFLEKSPHESAKIMRTVAIAGTNYPLVQKLAWVQVALVMGLVLRAGVAAPQNLVTNPGFETGNTSGWFAFGSPTLAVETSQVHSGSFACLANS
jgi:hypothetical protein